MKRYPDGTGWRDLLIFEGRLKDVLEAQYDIEAQREDREYEEQYSK